MYTCRESATHRLLRVSANTEKGESLKGLGQRGEGQKEEDEGGEQKGFGRGGPCVADPQDLATGHCCTYKHINTKWPVGMLI